MNDKSQRRSLFQRIFGMKRSRLLSVPVMDGPLKPNDMIEEGEKICSLERADNLTSFGENLLVSSNNLLFKINKTGEVELYSEQEECITAVAVSELGEIAIGMAKKGIIILDSKKRPNLIRGTEALKCITSLCFLNDGTLVLTNGSEKFFSNDWVYDLVNEGRSGSVISISSDRKKLEVLVDGLAYPSGICQLAGQSNKLAVTETWNSKIVEIDRIKKRVERDLLIDLPSYPARLNRLSNGHYILTNYSTRSQLIEFVLSEKRYLRRMIEEVPSQFWVAPSLSSKNSFKEPLQAGGVIRLGIHKPWAPTCSYGLTLMLDSNFQPIDSAHSRANGNRHGILSGAELKNDVFVASKGNGEIVKLSEFIK